MPVSHKCLLIIMVMRAKKRLFRMHKYKKKETLITLILTIFVLWKTWLPYCFFLFTCSLRPNWISYWNCLCCMNTSKNITKKTIRFQWLTLLSCITPTTMLIIRIKRIWNSRSNLQMDVLVLPCLHSFLNLLSTPRNSFSWRKNQSTITAI